MYIFIYLYTILPLRATCSVHFILLDSTIIKIFIYCGSNSNNGVFLYAIFSSLISFRCVFVASKHYPWYPAVLTP